MGKNDVKQQIYRLTFSHPIKNSQDSMKEKKKDNKTRQKKQEKGGKTAIRIKQKLG